MKAPPLGGRQIRATAMFADFYRQGRPTVKQFAPRDAPIITAEREIYLTGAQRIGYLSSHSSNNLEVSDDP